MASLGLHFTYDVNNIKPLEEMVYTGINYRITILSEGLIRLEYKKNGVFLDEATTVVSNRKFDKPNVEVTNTDKHLTIKSRIFNLIYTKEKPFKAPSFSPDSNLKVKINGTDKIWYYNHPEARNYPAAVKNLDDPKNIKYNKGLYSIDGFATIDDSKGYIIHQNGELEKRTDDNIDIYLFLYNREFDKCLADYFKLTGLPVFLPKYALGIWWNRDRVYSANDTKNLINLFSRHDIPLSVLLLSEFWHIKDHSNINLYKSGYTFDSILFPEPSGYINHLHEENIRLGLNLDPTEGISRLEPTFNMFANHLNHKNNNNIPYNVLNKDFMIMFLEYLINPLISYNVDFYWNDGNKNIDLTNFYLFSHMNKDISKRNFILSRNSNITSHKNAILYSGETIVDWKTLEMLPYINSSSSNIGVSWWSHDVGGFKDGIEDSDLYLRYVQFATFSPVFRFSAQRGPYYKREPWLWDIKTMAIVKEYCHFRYQLLPYLYSENYNYHKNGIPIIRPLYYETPELIDEPKYKNEYYFGSEIIISPITKQKNVIMNRSVERIFLPEGTWYEFKTGKKFLGNKRYVTFYKDEDYPIFVKAGAILPLAILGKKRNDLSNPENLEIDIFPGKSNSYKLYEDDGITNNYKSGKYHITSIEYNYMSNNYTVIIRPLEGANGIIPEFRNYIIKFRNTKMPENVDLFINGDKITDNIESYFEDTDFIIKIYKVDTTKQLTINCRGKNIEIDAVRIINEDINSIISDLKIKTNLKEKISNIMFSDLTLRKKRIGIRKLKKEGLDPKFMHMFLNLLEYTAEI